MAAHEILLRQVHPAWLQNGQPTSQAFRPTPKDQKLLSAYLSSLISAEESWVHYTKAMKLGSAGVWGVSGDDVASAQLTYRPDPEAFPEHAVIDYSSCETGGAAEKASKILKRKALARGCLYTPDSD
jgi:hypothetical protein